jgi:hypothetical protein
MLTPSDLRQELTSAATAVGDDHARAARAIALGRRRRVRRRQLLAGASAVTVLACGAVVAVSLGSNPEPAPTAATIGCLPGRAVVSTSRVASLPGGAEITIVNDTNRSVVVHIGAATAVVSPGSAEGQFPLSAGRQQVRCVTDGNPSAPAALSVVAARHT